MQFQRHTLPESIVRLLGLKGADAAAFDLDPSIKPTFVLFDVSLSPFTRMGVPCGGMAAQGAFAGEMSHVWVSPGRNSVLQILEMRLWNIGVAVITAQVWFGSASQLALIANNRASSKLFELVGQPGSAMGESRSSLIANGTRTGATSGTQLEQFEIAVDGRVVVTAPPQSPGWVLFGDEPQGIPGFGVNCPTANVELRASFYCREWELPG